MKVKKIALENFMPIDETEIKFTPGINVLYADNGVGKTSLLKCLYSATQVLE